MWSLKKLKRSNEMKQGMCSWKKNIEHTWLISKINQRIQLLPQIYDVAVYSKYGTWLYSYFFNHCETWL